MAAELQECVMFANFAVLQYFKQEDVHVMSNKFKTIVKLTITIFLLGPNFDFKGY